uniref:Uncharacterized protein n=1 Tax=Romanomermis culicivorax TaxID=13658 RepID=A0A915LA16_ROMCU
MESFGITNLQPPAPLLIPHLPGVPHIPTPPPVSPQAQRLTFIVHFRRATWDCNGQLMDLNRTRPQFDGPLIVFKNVKYDLLVDPRSESTNAPYRSLT